MDLERKIEAVLFYKAEPIKKSALAELFELTDESLEQTLTSLSQNLSNRGISLVHTDTEVQLVTAADMHDIIEQLKRDDLKRDIGKAGAETLAIILYRGPLTRAEIDRIRGVNSTFIIRNLLMRGLIEKRSNPQDSRSFTYAPTATLFNHLGVKQKEELPDFGVIMDSLDTFEKEDAMQADEDTNPFSA